MTETTYVTTASGAKQMLCPPDLPSYDPGWLSEREKYLFSRGWEVERGLSSIPTFRDPKGSRLRGELRDVKTLPNKGDDLHPTITLRQFHVPPTTYTFTIEEALEIQRRRDRAGDSGPTPLERLDIVEQHYNTLERELGQCRARIKALLTSQHLTFEALKLGLRELVGI